MTNEVVAGHEVDAGFHLGGCKGDASGNAVQLRYDERHLRTYGVCYGLRQFGAAGVFPRFDSQVLDKHRSGFVSGEVFDGGALGFKDEARVCLDLRQSTSRNHGRRR